MTRTSKSDSRRAPATIGTRLASYARWQRQCLFVGGGIGGVALLGDLVKDSFASAEDLRARFITLILLSGIALGYGYLQFFYAEMKLQNYKEGQQGIENASTVPQCPTFRYPWLGYILAIVGIVLLLLAGYVLYRAAWESANTPPPATPGPIHVELDPAQLDRIEKWLQRESQNPQESNIPGK